MNTKKYIDGLWREFRGFINAAYSDASKATSTNRGLQGDYRSKEDCLVLRDYAEDISWSDDLAALLGRETANERQHRSNRPSIPGFSNESAAKLIIMDNACKGSQFSEMPSATIFLHLRQTAAESEVIGYLIRNFVPIHWREAVNTLDYAELMKQGDKL